MKKIYSSFLILGIVAMAACHDGTSEWSDSPSTVEALSANGWVHSAITHDGDDAGTGYPIRFNADGTFSDPGHLFVSAENETAPTWEVNGSQIMIKSDDTTRVNIISLGSGFFTYDWYADFPDVGHDHYEFTAGPVCSFNASGFAGDFMALEDYGADGTYGPYSVTLVQDGANPNKFTFNKFWDSGLEASMVFNPDDFTVSFPAQDVDGEELTGVGSYDACTNSFSITTHYDGSEWNYVFTKP